VGRLRGKPWSVEEEKQLSELVKAGKRINEIAAVFGKSRGSIKKRMERLVLEVVVRQIQQTTTSELEISVGYFICSSRRQPYEAAKAG